MIVEFPPMIPLNKPEKLLILIVGNVRKVMTAQTAQCFELENLKNVGVQLMIAVDTLLISYMMVVKKLKIVFHTPKAVKIVSAAKTIKQVQCQEH